MKRWQRDLGDIRFLGPDIAVFRADVKRVYDYITHLEDVVREGGCHYYMDGQIGECQRQGETHPCLACGTLEPG